VSPPAPADQLWQDQPSRTLQSCRHHPAITDQGVWSRAGPERRST
jgi:hypothetical protein